MSTPCVNHYDLRLRCIGLERLSALQRLEMLNLPCNKPHAVACLVAQLQRLRTLFLQCCSAAGLPARPDSMLALDAATALTALRLQISADDVDIVQRLQFPPQLQVCHCNAACSFSVLRHDHSAHWALLCGPAMRSRLTAHVLHLQALRLTIVMTNGHSPDSVIIIVNALPMQVGPLATVECQRLL